MTHPLAVSIFVILISIRIYPMFSFPLTKTIATSDLHISYIIYSLFLLNQLHEL